MKLIDADALCKHLHELKTGDKDTVYEYYDDGIDTAISTVAVFPTIEAEPVRKGRWVPVTNGRGGFECSICHSYAPSYQDGVEWLSLYCPNCGAKMEPISASPENGQEVEA